MIQNDLLLINVFNKNGLISFDEDEQVHGLVQSDVKVEIVSLDDCGGFDGMIEYVRYIPQENIMFAFDKSKGMFVKKITDEIVPNKKVIWFCSQLDNSYDFCISSGVQVPIFNSKVLLNRYLSGEDVGLMAINDESVIKLFLNHGDYDETYKMIMSNGYFAYESGLYGSLDIDVSKKHIKTDNSIALSKILEKVNINVNSAFFLESTDYDLKKYEDVMQAERFVSHCHQITGDKVYFDNSGFFIDVEKCNFAKYVALCKESRLEANKMYVTYFESSEDVNAFEEELENFARTGKILPSQFYLQDECRWTGKCDINMSKRLNVKNGQLLPCNNSDVSVYEIDDDDLIKMVKINRLKQERGANRGCKECKYSKSCSRCICLPSSIDDECFCDIISKHPYVNEYIMKKNIKQLLSNSKVFFYRTDDLLFSNQAHPLLYTVSSPNFDMNKIIYLFKFDDEFFVFNIRNNNIVKIKEMLAFMLEGHSQGINISDIAKKMETVYHMDKFSTSIMITKGVKSLRSIGVDV